MEFADKVHSAHDVGVLKNTSFLNQGDLDFQRGINFITRRYFLRPVARCALGA